MVTVRNDPTQTVGGLPKQRLVQEWVSTTTTSSFVILTIWVSRALLPTRDGNKFQKEPEPCSPRTDRPKRQTRKPECAELATLYDAVQQGSSLSERPG